MGVRDNNQDDVTPKTVATMVREAIERNGYKDVKECARSIKVPYDLFNKVVGGHIPKDAQLIEYARKLKIDPRELILAAYREKAPEEMKRYFNAALLLEEHDGPVGEILDVVDSLNSDQLEQLLHVAQLIRAAPRHHCRKSTALLELYQQMSPETMDHFESLVLLALRNENVPGLKSFREAVEQARVPQRNRRRSVAHA